MKSTYAAMFVAILGGTVACRRASPPAVAPSITHNPAPATGSDASTQSIGTLLEFYTAVNEINTSRRCAWLRRCCAADAGLSDDLQRCNDPASSSEMLAMVVRDVEARQRDGRIRVSLSQASACLAAIRAAMPPLRAECGDVEGMQRIVPAFEDQLPECLAVVDGTAAIGARCEDSTDCAGSVTCYGDGPLRDPHREQRCAAMVPAGQPSSAAALCADGTFLEGGRCVARREENGACGLAGMACARGFFCDTAPTATEGVCHRLRAAGQACRQDTQCQSQSCEQEHCVTVCGGTPRG